jgi:hypothetical protein
MEKTYTDHVYHALQCFTSFGKMNFKAKFKIQKPSAPIDFMICINNFQILSIPISLLFVLVLYYKIGGLHGKKCHLSPHVTTTRISVFFIQFFNLDSGKIF